MIGVIEVFIVIIFFLIMFKFSNSFSFFLRIFLIFLLPITLVVLSFFISTKCPFSVMARHIAADSELGVIVIFGYHCVVTLGFFSPLYMYLINKFHGKVMTKYKFLILISITTVLFVIFNCM